MKPVLVALLLLAGTSCISLRWQRINVDQPVADPQIEGLTPGVADLGVCLAAMGAPTRVYEDGDSGVVLAYGWRDQSGWDVSASYAFARFVSASFSFSDDIAHLRGVVLLLDRSLILRDVRRGMLADLVRDVTRRRPTELDGASDG